MDTASVKRRWIYLLTGSAGYFFVGILFSWSIIKVPLREAIGAGTQTLASVYTLSVCFFCIGNLLTGVFLKKLGVKRVEKGIFGADMKVSLVNDGPVTILYDTEIWCKNGN